MLAVLWRRLLSALPTLLGASVVAFGLIRLVPGDPVMLLLGERGSSPEVYKELQAALGLDLPVWKQYWVFLTNALTGDLGQSIHSKQPVLVEFMDRFPATLELSITGLIFAIICGIPLGMISAIKRNSIFDYAFMGVSLTGYSMPIFWWGLILILVFSVNLGWTPVSGRMSALYDVEPVTGFMLIDSFFMDDVWEERWAAFWDAVRHLILPAIALGTIPLAVIARMTRSSLLEVLGEDYIRTAKAKGLSAWRIVVVHGLRNALIPIVTVIGLMVGALLTGAILTETIFSWPGIGKWLVNSVTSRDYPVIQGGILLIAAMIIFVNAMVDIMYAVVNPKLRSMK